MSAHILLNLLNELGKIDKMQGLLSILSLSRNEFNKFNNTGARMLDDIKFTKKSHFGVKTSNFCHLLRNVIKDVITLRANLSTSQSVFFRFHCMALFHSQTRRHVIRNI